MAKDDHPEDDAPPRSPRRRRRPPVLELEATEIGGEGTSARARKPRSAAAGESRSAPWRRWRERLAAIDWRGLASVPLLAGVLGAVAGAAAVLFVLSLRDSGADPRLSELTREVAALSARLERLAVPPPVAVDPGALGERIDRLTAAVGEAERRLAAIERQPAPRAPDLSAVAERAAAIEAALKDLRAALTDLRRVAEQAPAAATKAAIDALGGRIGALEERIASLAAPRPPLADASLADEIAALNALASAIESGRPFAKELAAVRARLGERAAPLAAFEPVAANGLPTVAALAEQFSPLVPHMLRYPEPNGTLLSRLVSSAVRLVEVRPVGEPEGASVGAVVARMETKLGRGDLSGALAESAALPNPARAVAADWIAVASLRRDAELAVKELMQTTLAGAAEGARP